MSEQPPSLSIRSAGDGAEAPVPREPKRKRLFGILGPKRPAAVIKEDSSPVATDKSDKPGAETTSLKAAEPDAAAPKPGQSDSTSPKASGLDAASPKADESDSGSPRVGGSASEPLTAGGGGPDKSRESVPAASGNPQEAGTKPKRRGLPDTRPPGAPPDPWTAFTTIPEKPPGRIRRGLRAGGRGLIHEYALSFYISALLAVGLTWPTLRYPLHTLPQDLGDPSRQAWQVSWVGHVLRTNPVKLWQSNAYFPAKDSFAFGDNLLGYAPFGLIGDGPNAAILRYNILFVVAHALLLFGAYALVRQLGVRPTGAAVAAAAFAWAPWRLAQEGHLDIVSAGAIPLALALLARGHGWSLRYGFRPALRHTGWAALGWLVAIWQLSLGFSLGLPFAYVLGGIVLFLLIAVPIRWFRQRRRTKAAKALAPALVPAAETATAVTATGTEAEAQKGTADKSEKGSAAGVTEASARGTTKDAEEGADKAAPNATDRATDKAADQAGLKPAGQTAQKQDADKSTQKTADQSIRKTADPDAQKSTAPATEKAGALAAEKTAAPATEKAAAPAAEKTAVPETEKAAVPATEKAAAPATEKTAVPAAEKAPAAGKAAGQGAEPGSATVTDQDQPKATAEAAKPGARKFAKPRREKKPRKPTKPRTRKGPREGTVLGWRLLLTNFLGVLFFVGVGAVIAIPYLRVPDSPTRSSEIDFFSPPLRSLLIGPAESRIWGAAHATPRASLGWAAEMSLLPGFMLYALALAGLLFSIWRWRQRLFLVLALAASVILTLGTTFFGGRWTYLPLFGHLPASFDLRIPGRLMLWTTLLLAILAGGAVDEFVRRAEQLAAQRTPPWPGPWMRLATLVPLLLVALEGWSSTAHPVAPTQPAAMRTVGGPVLVLPTGALEDQIVQLWTTSRYQQVANGGGTVAAAQQAELRAKVTAFPDLASIAYLRSIGVNTVLLVRSDVAGTPWEQAGELPVDSLGIRREDLTDAVVFRLN
ncbi:hypothetical protein [Actinoplanes awajinensis]|uniref:hypothetical protein n=1 Tax=Actinoplanes awajinensis TaxID=135946 RepID=UPI000A4EC200